MKKLLCVMILVMIAVTAAQAEDTVLASLPSWKFEQSMALPEVPEPSGLCYYPAHDSLFIVDDGAADRKPAVYEISLSGDVLQKLELGSDLEGICYCPADGLIYIADESDELVYSLDPNTLSLQQTYQISRSMAGTELVAAGGNGFEGIEYIPAGNGEWSDCFILLNQDDPHRLLAVRRSDLVSRSAGGTEAVGYWDIASINAGSLHFDDTANQLWVVHSWMNVMEIWDVETMELLSWEVVPGAAQEAVAVDGSGRLWIGSDSGGLASYTAVP